MLSLNKYCCSVVLPPVGKNFALSNGKASTINRALGGSTYPSYKLVHSSLCKKF